MRICFEKKNGTTPSADVYRLLSFFIHFHSNFQLYDKQIVRLLQSMKLFSIHFCAHFLLSFLCYLEWKHLSIPLTIGLSPSFTCRWWCCFCWFYTPWPWFSCARVTDYPQIKCIVLIIWQLIKIKQVIGPSMVNWTAKN